MISFIVPTVGRASLSDALASIETWPGDEILVVGALPLDAKDARPRYVACPPGHDWGCTERTRGLALATQPYLAFLDDDDTYAPGARRLLQAAIEATPDRPRLFRAVYPNGFAIWREPALVCGNVSTQMMLIPNRPEWYGRWTPRREGDFDFLTSMRWPADAIVWDRRILARFGHDDSPAPMWN